jgi:flagellar hook-associated protein 2
MALVNFFGAASGLDTGGLIDALLEQQRKSRIAPLQKKAATLSETKSAFSDLSTKLNKLKDVAYSFRSISSGVIARSATSSNENVLTATATNGATNTSATVNVTQIASNGTLSFNNTFSSRDAVINPNANGTVDFTIGTGASAESFSINVSSTTSVQDFIDSFNNSNDKAVASTVNVGSEASPEYKIVISSLAEGTDAGNLSVTDSSGILAGVTLSQATDAQLSISGISGSITRSSNSISDLIPGVKLQLSKPGTTTIAVSTDTESSATNARELVEAFNELAGFIREKDTVSTQNINGQDEAVFGSLSLTSMDESVLSSIKNGFFSSSLTGGLINSMADLGITTKRDGSLNFDQNTFAAALSKDSASVNKIMANLGDALGSTGGIIDQFNRFGGLLDNAKKSTDEEISRVNQKILDLQRSVSRQEENLIAQFSRLESQISRMQSQGSYLQSIIGGIK